MHLWDDHSGCLAVRVLPPLAAATSVSVAAGSGASAPSAGRLYRITLYLRVTLKPVDQKNMRCGTVATIYCQWLANAVSGRAADDVRMQEREKFMLGCLAC